MKQKNRLIYALIAFVFASAVFTSCSDDDDGDEITIVGSWSLDKAEPEVTVNTIPLKKYLTDSAGMTETVAEAQYTAMLAEMSMSNGTLEFMDDGTYTAKFGTDDDSGTWVLSDDSKTLTVVSAKDNEKNVMDVVSLTETTLTTTMVHTETEDMNNDGVDDSMVATTTMTFMKK